MRYLHGDSSPFPLNENFLETLCAAADTCVALFGADVAAEHARGVRASAGRAVSHEVARVEQLTRDVERALGHHVPKNLGLDATNATEAAALRIAELARGALEDTRTSIDRWSERAIADALAAIPSVDDICGAFLVKHQLPGTSWSFEWKAELKGSPGRAVMVSATDVGLNASYEVALPAGHLWAQAVKGRALTKRAVAIPLAKMGWFGKVRVANERLDKLYVTHVRHNAESSIITLAKSRREPSASIELTVRSTLRAGVWAMRLDAAGGPLGDRVALTGEACDGVYALWDRIEASISDIARYRKRVLLASLGELGLGRVEKPGVIADAIIGALAPTVAEMLRHSRTRGELALKRDLGDGKREEMFVMHDEVTKRWAMLAPDYQDRFDVFDLEDGRTSVMSKSQLALAVPASKPRSSRRALTPRPRSSESSISAP